MLEILKNMLTGRNEFASGGLLLMIVGALSVYLRAVPERLWYWIVGQTTMVIPGVGTLTVGFVRVFGSFVPVSFSFTPAGGD